MSGADSADRPATDLWTVYGPDGKRCTVATFYTRTASTPNVVKGTYP